MSQDIMYINHFPARHGCESLTYIDSDSAYYEAPDIGDYLHSVASGCTVSIVLSDDMLDAIEDGQFLAYIMSRYGTDEAAMQEAAEDLHAVIKSYQKLAVKT